jgi:hypothetical protein
MKDIHGTAATNLFRGKSERKNGKHLPSRSEGHFQPVFEMCLPLVHNTL